MLKSKGYCFVAVVCLFGSVSAETNEHNYANDFKSMKFEMCDATFHKLEGPCEDMICRDQLVHAYAECWKRSMNAELDKRLLKLKIDHDKNFSVEMNLQKEFNQSVQNQCGKDCEDGNGMKGISFNFCRVDAYKYRTMQAMQINQQQFSVPITKEKFSLKYADPSKEKQKDTKFYNLFAMQLCQMDKSVWGAGKQIKNCQASVLQELDKFDFTDDVCNLS